MQELMQEREKIKKELNSCIIYKKKVGRDLARAEYEYKRVRTINMHRLMIHGYELNGEKTKPIAATAVYDMVQGIPEVADARLKRDLRKADFDVTQEKIYQCKLELQILESDIKAIRLGG